MRPVLVLNDTGTVQIDADLSPTSVRVPTTSLDSVVGWHLEEHGLCQGDVCIPLRAASKPDKQGTVDLLEIADALGRPAVVDADAGVVALGIARDDRRRALRELQLPAFTLPDLDGNPVHSTDWRGRKTLVLAFSSW